MTSTAQDQYPHDLAGAPTTPPELAPAELVAAWREYEEEERAELAETPLLGAQAGRWRMAECLQVLLQEADAANPNRDKRSDGGVGDPRHQALGKASDHNPWVRDAKGVGVVRARDFDVDGLDVAGAFERIRAKAAAGQLPQLLPGGYLILSGRITTPDFSGWREYKGENPHVTHGHVSAGLTPEAFDDRRPWNVWTAPKPAASTTAKPSSGSSGSRTASATGPDLRGRAFGLRGEEGASGPRVRELQRWFARWYPAYARELATDGVWGPRTSAVVREFAHRSRIRDADGRNIGPRIARALTAAGFRG